MKNKLALLILLILWTLFLSAAYFTSLYGGNGQGDFNVYYQASIALRNGMSPYGNIGYIYPPLLAQLLMPLSYLALADAWNLWFVAQIALMAFSIQVVTKEIGIGKWAFVVPPLFLPFFDALYIGQVTIILAAILIAAWWCIHHQRPVLAGILLALAAWIKLYPILIIAVLLLQHRWNVVLAAFLTGIILLIFQVSLSGFDSVFKSFEVVFQLSQNGQPVNIIRNMSIQGFSAQLFQDNLGITPLLVSSLAYASTRIVLSLGIFIGTLYAAWRTTVFNESYALAITAALLLSPTLWTSGVPILLLVFAILLSQHVHYSAWFCALSCILISIYSLFLAGCSPEARGNALIFAMGFYALMLTWLLLWVRLLQFPNRVQKTERLPSIESDKPTNARVIGG